MSSPMNLQSGQRINLSKGNRDRGGLTNVRLGLSWGHKGRAVDLDLSIVFLDVNEHMFTGGEPDFPEGLCFFGFPTHPGVTLLEDNRSGVNVSSGNSALKDIENINIKLGEVREDVYCMSIGCTSYSEAAPIPMGTVIKPVLTIYDATTGEAFYKFELAEDENTSLATSVEIGRIYRKDGDWRFHPVGEALGRSANGLEDLCAKYHPAHRG